jgi:hypothetical protein
MLLLPLAVVVGLVAGLLLGGRLGALTDLRWRHGGPLAVAVGLEWVAGRCCAAGSTPRAAVALGSEGVAGALIALNLRARRPVERAGLAMVVAGWAANIAAMLPSGAMPVSLSALRAAGMAGTDVAAGHLGKHTIGSTWLGDDIPLRALGAVVSPGDLAMLAGIAIFMAAATRRANPARETRPRDAERAPGSRAPFARFSGRLRSFDLIRRRE